MSRALTQYLFSFRGRITRRGFWIRYVLPTFVLWILANASLPVDVEFIKVKNPGARIDEIDASVTAFGWFWIAAHYAVFGWVGAVASVKRLHDRDLSGWLALISFVPGIGLLWFFVFLGFVPGTKGPNHFGPDPRERQNSDQAANAT